MGLSYEQKKSELLGLFNEIVKEAETVGERRLMSGSAAKAIADAAQQIADLADQVSELQGTVEDKEVQLNEAYDALELHEQFLSAAKLDNQRLAEDNSRLGLELDETATEMCELRDQLAALQTEHNALVLKRQNERTNERNLTPLVWSFITYMDAKLAEIKSYNGMHLDLTMLPAYIADLKNVSLYKDRNNEGR